MLEASSPQVRYLFPLIHCFLSQQLSTPRLLVVLLLFLPCVLPAIERCELRTVRARPQRRVLSRLTNTQIKNNGIPVLKDFCLKKELNCFHLTQKSHFAPPTAVLQCLLSILFFFENIQGIINPVYSSG